MPAEGVRVQAEGRDGTLDDLSHRGRLERARAHVAVLVDATEDSSAGDASGTQPGPQSLHGAGVGGGAHSDTDPSASALPVGLRAPHREVEPTVYELHVAHLQADKLAAPQGGGKAEQDQRTVA